MSVLDLAQDVKPYLSISGTDNDTRLEAALDAAEALMAQKIGPLTATTFTDVVDGGGRSALTLERFPVVALSSVTTDSGATVDTSLLTLDRSGVVTYKSRAAFNATSYTVEYAAGWEAPLPPDVIRAVAALTQHLWSPQRGPATRGGPTDQTASPAYALPHFVEQMVSHYIPLGT